MTASTATHETQRTGGDTTRDRNTELTTAAVFDELESNVRSYCRSFPAVFDRAKGAELFSSDGRRFLDFLAGAGALNYGHNHPLVKRALLDYLADDRIVTGLDLHTEAKAQFLSTFRDVILVPAALDYRVQFTGPTGTNAVEAALKLARLVTGRHTVVAFTGAYHGHSMGALAATANRDHRAAAGTPLAGATFLPFPGSPGVSQRFDAVEHLEALAHDGHSGLELPAAVIVETVQGEGGINVAPPEWLLRLRHLCTELGALLIVDDIQVGCGRTGPFFSFEPTLTGNLRPDLVAVSKSISGLGLPMALLLIRPEHDVWKPADHTGTFRGNQLAFVCARAALEVFRDEELPRRTAANASYLEHRLAQITSLDPRLVRRGVGMIWGIDLSGVDPSGALTRVVSARCFDEGLIIERVGRNDTVLKVLPPLTISRDQLEEGCSIVERAIKACLEPYATAFVAAP